MIDELQQDAASLYVLGLLEYEEARHFETELHKNAELKRLVAELEEGVAALAHNAPARALPPALKARILDEISTKKKVVHPSAFATWPPWAIAACLAIACVFLFQERTHLQKEITDLRGQDTLSQMKIETMTALIDSYSKGVAVVVWNEQKQTGILKIQNMPLPKPDQDYQLWVVDPNYKQPVNAGVFGVDASGLTKATFKPTQPITSADKFAISLERKGGAPQHEGPIVMITN